MCWMERFGLVMRSSITFLWEKVEDPERMLHQLIIDMEEELEAVRRSVAEAIADEILLRKQAETARTETDQWLQRATTAMNRDDEANARSALEQKGLAATRAEEAQKQFDKQHEQTEKLRRAVKDLEEKIRQARQKRTLLMARLSSASSSRRINSALDRAGNHSAFAEFGRLEARVDRAEAMSEAYDRLEGRDPDAEELERQFAAQDRKDQLQKELEELKRRVAEPGSTDAAGA